MLLHDGSEDRDVGLDGQKYTVYLRRHKLCKEALPHRTICTLLISICAERGVLVRLKLHKEQSYLHFAYGARVTRLPQACLSFRWASAVGPGGDIVHVLRGGGWGREVVHDRVSTMQRSSKVDNEMGWSKTNIRSLAYRA